MSTEFQELKDHISQLTDEVFVSQYAAKISEYNDEIRQHIHNEVGTRGLDPEQIEHHRSVEAARVDEQRKAKLTGLGGWLILYILTAVITLFANTGQLIAEGWESYVSTPFGWVVLAAMALQLAALLLVLLKSGLARPFAMAACGGFAVVALYSLWMLREHLDVSVVFVPARTLVVCALWTGYFLTSERVRLTFGTRKQEHSVDVSV